MLVKDTKGRVLTDVHGRLMTTDFPWAIRMVMSYKKLNPEQAQWFYESGVNAEIELYNRLVGLYDTFKHKEVCDFIYIMQVSGNTTEAQVTKTGDTLRWDMNGTIYNQNNLPSEILNDGDFISVTTEDGWDGITLFYAFSSNLKGTCPDFNFPNVTLFRIQDNQFSGNCPNFNFPNVTDFRIHRNQFSGNCPNFNFPNVETFFIHTNQFSGTCPDFNFPNVTDFRIQENQFSGNCPNFNFPNVTDFRIHRNQFSGNCPNFNFPNVTLFRIDTNQFSGFDGFDFVTINLGNFLAQSNAIPTTHIDDSLAAFVAANKTTGTRVYSASGGTNGVPSASGDADIATLQSRGWTVTVNS